MNWTIAQERPRVLLTPADLPRLRRLAQTTHRREMQSLLLLLHQAPREAVAAGDDGTQLAYRLAFLHLLTGEKAHADACATVIERILNLGVSAGYFEAQRRLKAFACAYDWCHDALDQNLRERIGHAALAHAHALYVNYEVYPRNYLAGHEVNHVPYMLLSAVAMGEEIFGAEALMQHLMPRLQNMLACYAHFLKKDSFPQSYSYTSTYMAELPVVFQGVRAAFGQDWFKQYEWLRNVVKWWTYAFRDDETFIRHGDYFCAYPVLRNAGYYRAFAAIASNYRDGLAQWWLNRFSVQGNEPDQFIFEERENAPHPLGPDNLPRTKLFEPMGIAIARGDFGQGSVAAFKCTPVYLHNHCHRDQNQITLYHKGDLAIDSGAYDGYETPHWSNYYIRTIAHNTLVVYDPAEKMISRGKEFSNDGGQRFINQPDFAPRSLEDIRAAHFRDGRILAYQEGDRYSYVCGDASNCYAREKLTRFLRHVLFVLDWPHRGGVSLFVLDEVELAHPGLAARILLHTMEAPEVDGPRIVAREGGGRLSMHVLLPEEARIELVGGDRNEFLVDGKNYAMVGPMKGPHTPGQWRAEISPAVTEGTQLRFLSVLCPADVERDEESPPELRQSSAGWVIAQDELCVALLEPGKTAPVNGRRNISITLAR